MSTEKYRLTSIRASYGRNLGIAVDELALTAGGLYVLIGPNGSGKSTLLSVMAFLKKPEQGTICFDGAQVSWTARECFLLRQRVTLLHQNPYLFSGSVSGNVAFGMVARGARRDTAREVTRESLAKVGLKGFESRAARKLSSGESRRVALARALACEPEVLLLDEPFAHVDRASAKLLETVILALAAGGATTLVISSHDERLGSRLGATTIYLDEGKLDKIQDSRVM